MVKPESDSKNTEFPYIECKGTNLNDAFQKAALELMGLITDVTQIEQKQPVTIFCESADLDLLFSDWINTLLWELNDKKMLFSRFDIHVEGINVKGKIWGEPIDPHKHELKRQNIQGIAFDRLSCEEINENGVMRVRVSGVLNDVDRHGYHLEPLWSE